MYLFIYTIIIFYSQQKTVFFLILTSLFKYKNYLINNTPFITLIKKPVK